MYTVILRVGYKDISFKFGDLSDAAKFMDTVFDTYQDTEGEQISVEMRKDK